MKLSEEQIASLYAIIQNYIELGEKSGRKLEYSNIQSYINLAIDFVKVECDEEDIKKIFSRIEYNYKITHSEGHVIFNEYEETRDWYTNAEIKDNFFWNRYRQYLVNKTKLDPTSINLLDEVTLPNIMNCLGDPKENGEPKKPRRGLIIGDVQSGKTATYTGLICKAADAGYKLVILLAGITESLRQQTQERIDEGIVGKSGRIINNQFVQQRVGVGLDGQESRAFSITSISKDFTSDLDKILFSLSSQNSLVLFVIKKNVSVLEKLLNWLKDNNMNPVKGCIDIPMLLIDDEADNASVNTRKDEADPTRTNKLIRQICNIFGNATYVGFTATPFANVFIDPDSEDSMKRADLFPEHFIYALPTPSSYIGANRIYNENGDYHDNLRYITDITEPDYTSDEYKEACKNNIDELNEGPFYYRHTKNWQGEFPDSLRESVLCYFLANAVRDLRGSYSAPRSMLINMSRFVKVQRVIGEYIEGIWTSFFNTVRFDFSDKPNKNKKLALYHELESIWNKHFTHIHDITFDRVIKKENLIKAVEKIKILIVNGAKGSDKLDYKTNPSLRVIAIGGLALSRGLTLEGLLVSYFYRNTATFDVLMQMGRWFGYRYGYDDLFQIWSTKLSAEWYAEIALASDELKEDIKKMYEQRLTPKDFGLRVRDNCEALQITASNKMRSSYNWNILFSYYGNIYDTPYISLNSAQNKENLKVTEALVKGLFDEGYKLKSANLSGERRKGSSLYLADVPKATIVGYLSRIKCSLANMYFNIDNLLNFITDPDTLNVEKWDVVFEGGDSDKYYDITGLEGVKCMKRAIYSENGKVVQISSRRRVLGSREGEFALTKEQIQTAKEAQYAAWDGDRSRQVPIKAFFQYLPERKPILIVMLIAPESQGAQTGNGDSKALAQFREELGDDKIVAYAIGFPGVMDSGKSCHYKVNKVYYEMNLQDDLSNNDEEDEE
jgi:hypothetical protein